MTVDARLHVRAAVWGHADNRIAVLLLEGGFAPAGLTSRGLTLVSSVDRVALPVTAAWRVHLDAAGALTVHWPHRRPLLDAVPVEQPDAWRWAARRRGAVLLLLGDHVGLTEPDPAHRRTLLAAAASRGALAATAAPFTTTR
ncbi:hypothetical protein [Saccharothrix texasensis]|uniref:Uncharacterized protein n=1 Tax=Saccharothrix texasensis TaxID=103734 RepID=A0A3N1H0H4_9PSEU|nr:hypothetical protein [Saccharothrix texasensis]ROP35752.1 hypothetical protein EDD40_1004 [Saccharothrix texasensis]